MAAFFSFSCLSLLLVATLAPNVPAMQELHFAVSMVGAVLCTLNMSHDSAMLSTILMRSEAKVIFVDKKLLKIAQGTLALLADKKQNLPLLVVICQTDKSPTVENLNPRDHDYESLLGSGDSSFAIRWPRTEFDPISINCTSGTTSRPKGVV
ncbi:hypothetical protein KY290_019647 [Solanum tuberosum]|uniref:AMP-dependent synthetase/ligase domain-containing protein n=1 Tax=Solanum tuberosum TaxID=4113 RepID=A0ABQ7VHM8_SOLTU|nr:hypothetical protein KY284_016142 [Solanum tuberosum]KAH0701859.1 hypothetical protein KY285_016137 [Solanum tuberosum]KAH0763574.1 hypothetical protein KY290_019647 [Solanum tuberosum]